MGNHVAAVELTPPYLVFVGDTTRSVFAKTGAGLVHWCRDRCLGQYRTTSDAVNLGVPDLTISEAVAAGVKTMVVGVANVGGFYPETWIDAFFEATGARLDIAAGMHARLNSLPGLADAAAAAGTRLIDVRVPPGNLPIGSGRKRTGRRLLTVGTDCASGKKYTALAIDREMGRRGFKSTFRATGQTGIMIAGSGIPIDAVVSDFLAGAAEMLSPDNDPDHWDVIEGQGAIYHPGYAGVTLGLLHGSQPDAIVLCHEAGRTSHEMWEDFPLPGIEECIDRYLLLGRTTSPEIQCVGISVNTSRLGSEQRARYLEDLEAKLNLPCVDPVASGVGPIVDLIEREF